MTRTAKLSKGILVTLCFIFYVGSYLNLQDRAQSPVSQGEEHFGVWGLPPVALEVFALEFKGLFADYLVLEAGAALGTSLLRDGEGYKLENQEIDWDAVNKMFIGSQALDPSFLQTIFLAQGWLPWEPASMVEETQSLLKVTARNRPWDWQPYRTMAFNAYYFEKNFSLASEYFLKAAQIDHAPSFLAIVGSRLASKGGDTDMAIIIVNSMLSEMTVDDSGYTDLSDRLGALVAVREIENALKSFQKRFSRLPYSLDEIVDSGILSALPINPYNLDYCIDKAGKVYFDNIDCVETVIE